MPQPKSGGAEREALFVRIPTAQAQRLDRAAFELKVSKQDLISGLVARYVDPASPSSLEALRALNGPLDADGRRIVVEPGQPDLTLGRHEFTPAPPPAGDVLTLADAARLLQVAEEEVARLAQAGELPGRRIGEQWRFARQAILDWLGADS